MLEGIRKALSRKPSQVAKCGAMNCANYVEIGDGPQPDIHICQTCSARMNEGIVRFLHSKTGKITGGYHAIDGYTR